MHHSKGMSRASVILFTSILVIGAAAVTVAYRSSQTFPSQTPMDEKLTERHKQLAAAEGEMSKWLLGLASGALAGLVGVRLKDPGNADLVSPVLSASYAFLLLSLYGAFLSYEANMNILRVGPIDYLYGDQFRLPVLVQFWCLLVALILLGIWFFRPSLRAITLVAVIAMCGSSTAAHAETVDAGKCTRDWYQDRLHETEESPNLAISVLGRLSKQPGAKTPRICADIESILDELRAASVDDGKTDDLKGFNKYLKSMNDELENPQLSTSSIVHRIIELMSPWDGPVAILSVRSSKGPYQILLNSDQVGLTNWTRRLKPGTYSLRVVQNFQLAYSADSLSLLPNQTVLIDLDRLPK